MLHDSRGGSIPQEVARFSDFAEPGSVLDGDKIRIDDLINRDVMVIGYKISSSKFEKNKSGKCLTLQVEVNGVHRVVFTGSDVLIDQMQKYGERIPFIAVIRKVDRFYTLS